MLMKTVAAYLGEEEEGEIIKQELNHKNSLHCPTNHLIKTVLSSTTANAGTDMEIGFAYHVAAGQFNEPAKSRFFLSVGADSTGNGSVDLMYSFTENKFTTGTFTEDQFFRIIEISNYNNWKRYRTTLRDVSFGTATDAKIEVKLFPLSTNGVFDYSIFHIFHVRQTPLAALLKKIEKHLEKR